jgi:Arc/MetJ-type ribon-helix-helix transcriptional regulator
MITKIDDLIKLGEYPNRSEAVRDGVRRLLESRGSSSEMVKVSVKDLKKFVSETKT